MLFSEMLEKFNPKHSVEVNMLISQFNCGCTSTITFAGRATNYYGRHNDNFVFSKDVWHSCDNCSIHSHIDFSEISHLKYKELKLLATEIFVANSIKVTIGEK